ncbi:3',5'-cyclic-AMP phosphodiesterase [Marinobacter sp. X15-166B]|uniref:3',5'-cyclic-AMP phosphodiesterase n=1 Tax=Marinobacter sp. X15-166B TaxID=1897620 RepID=UPI00085C1281|nr:3',5'-cyclic-AMP phosphodiesterase [Marinobacter sp. X15-166B]OEY66604.1 phosphodiesterase [Marinobacter sp. X15-166B]
MTQAKFQRTGPHPQRHPRAIQVLQLTDPHLMAAADATLLGVNTRDSLDAVIAAVKAEPVQPDLILVTGDLTQDASPAAYQALADKLAEFDCPSHWIPGNHDNADVLKAVAGPLASHKHLLREDWQIVLLDSSQRGNVAGWLADEELAFLDHTLQQHAEQPALIALHHHPVDIASGWMDGIGLHNREAFWAVIDRHPQVRAVVWGHIHQTLDQYRGKVRLLATPSTCIQFEAGSDTFSVEERAPGYRWLTLLPSGELITEVKRASDFQVRIDRHSTGY